MQVAKEAQVGRGARVGARSDDEKRILAAFESVPPRDPATAAAAAGAVAPLPQDEYIELIRTTAEERVRLAALNHKPELTLQDTEFVHEFVCAQSVNPDREILKAIWEIAHRAEKAVRRAAGNSYETAPQSAGAGGEGAGGGRGGRGGIWPRIHSPWGLLAWPFPLLWDAAFGRLDLLDKHGGRTTGESIARDAMRRELLGEMGRDAVAAAAAAGGAASSTVSSRRSSGSAASQAQAGGARQPRHRTRTRPQRAPVGQQAVLMRAGPKPGAAWSILTAVLGLALIVLICINSAMYWNMKRNDGLWQAMYDANGSSMGWINKGGCYRVCSDGFGWRWRALLREWFIGSGGGSSWPV